MALDPHIALPYPETQNGLHRKVLYQVTEAPVAEKEKIWYRGLAPKIKQRKITSKYYHELSPFWTWWKKKVYLNKKEREMY